VLLLENVHDLPGALLFINRDMAAGTTIKRARRVLAMFAELHAGFFGWDESRRDALLPLKLHNAFSRSRRLMGQAMNASAIEPCRKNAPEHFTAELAETCWLANRKWEEMHRWWYREPLTLIHGDSHLGNVFEYTGDDGARMGMLDFQAVQWSKGIRDVQYFLINSLEPKLLAEHEEMLIDHYIAESAQRGMELGRDETREQYRAFSYQTLTTAVFAAGLGSLTEQGHTVDTILRRSTAAAERLDLRGWIEDLR